MFPLMPDRNANSDVEYMTWLLNESDMDLFWSGVELGLRSVDVVVRRQPWQFESVTQLSPDDAIAEFNARLLEARIGFQYESGDTIRVDS